MKVLKCDRCGREIPIITKKIFGMEIKTFDTGKIHLKEWYTGNLFNNVDLCKSCANEISRTIDYELLKTKIDCFKNSIERE